MRRVNFWLTLAILGGVLIAPSAWFPPTPVWAQTSNPVCTIINKSGYPDKQVYICYTSNVGGVSNHFDWNTGMFVACQPSDNKLTISGQTDKYCEYYIRLDNLKQPDGKYRFTLTKSPGARIWFSFKTPLYFHVNVDVNNVNLGLREPSTDDLNDPNYQTLFDKMELTYNDLGVTMNITSVDFVDIPLMFELKNNDSSYGTFGFNHPQSVIINAMKAGLAQYNMVTPYRVLSPMTLNPVSTFPKTTYFDPYVNYCWDTVYKSPNKFSVYVKGYWWDGTVSGNVLTLTNTTDLGGETHTINRPSSLEVIKCTGVFAPTGDDPSDYRDRDGQLKDEVNEALNRSTMHLTFTGGKADWRDAIKFYKQNGLPDVKYCPNTYSDILHTVAINNKAYGFPMDEGWASKLENQKPVTDAIVTINSCKASLVSVESLLLDGN